MMHRDAVLSACATYRYTLTRRWQEGSRSVLWIMLNPSTANALIDDPTIRRCIAFSRGWGRDAMTVCNLYAYRATSPGDMWADQRAGFDVVGPENDRHILKSGGDVIVCAWGAGAQPERARAVLAMLDGAAPIMCLGTTKAGAPRHPLYVAGDTPLQPYRQPYGTRT